MPAERYTVGSRVTAAAHVRPYVPGLHEPLFRPIRIFALDPASSLLEGSIATVHVPYEPLEPGFRGSLFEVDLHDAGAGCDYEPALPDAPAFTLTAGRAPAAGDPYFHQQSVYAVASLVYDSFRQALGRDLSWGFDPRPRDGRLVLQPYGCPDQRNAFYDRDAGAIRFGYFQARGKVSGRTLPGGFVFTALGHDIVAHEMAHALLDGLRARFLEPSHPDVLALHEGFADLVAVFQRFSYPDVVRAAIRQANGQLSKADLLADIARQFGQTTTGVPRLRTAIDEGPPRSYASIGVEEHLRGGLITTAVFSAFQRIFARRTEQLVRLATNGSGVLPAGELPPDLLALLCKEAAKVARQFLSVCIRALDYCPPVDVRFGEYLRAVITADSDLVPHDPLAYREAWMDTFWERDIYPPDVGFLSVDSLRWGSPQRRLPRLRALDFAELAFEGDPGRAAGEEELLRQAGVLGGLISDERFLDEFGLTRPNDPRLHGDAVERPCIESIRTARRMGPNGRIIFDLVAEVTQRRLVQASASDPAFDFLGGATVIIDPYGIVRYVIRKSVVDADRLEEQREFMRGAGRARWSLHDGRLQPERQLFHLMHEGGDSARQRP